MSEMTVTQEVNLAFLDQENTPLWRYTNRRHAANAKKDQAKLWTEWNSLLRNSECKYCISKK